MVKMAQTGGRNRKDKIWAEPTDAFLNIASEGGFRGPGTCDGEMDVT